MGENIIERVRGDYLSPEDKDLPILALCADTSCSVECDVPEIGRVLIRYRRMTSKHGKFSRTFWSPEHVELIDPPIAGGNSGAR